MVSAGAEAPSETFTPEPLGVPLTAYVSQGPDADDQGNRTGPQRRYGATSWSELFAKLK